MSIHCPKRIRGFSLIEVIVAILTIALVAFGTSGYRYYSAVDIRQASVKIAAARLGSMLLDSWKGMGGDSSYSDSYPVEFCQGLEVYYNAAGTAVPAGFTALDSTSNPNYRFVVNGVNYYATMAYQDQADQPLISDNYSYLPATVKSSGY